MTNSAKSEADMRRKAHFREIARDIVANDRECRKHRQSVDTGGSIARALERAYKMGVNESTHHPPGITQQADLGTYHDGVNRPIEWLLIPPRPRHAFRSICLFGLGEDVNLKINGSNIVLKHRVHPFRPSQWIMVPEIETCRWGERTIAPLVRLGLLKEDLDGLRISAKGIATWWMAVATVEKWYQLA